MNDSKKMMKIFGIPKTLRISKVFTKHTINII